MMSYSSLRIHGNGVVAGGLHGKMARPAGAGAVARLEEQIENDDKGQEDAQERVLGRGRAAGASGNGDEHEADADEEKREESVYEPEGEEHQPDEEPQRQVAVHNIPGIAPRAFAHKGPTQICGAALVAEVSVAERADDMIAPGIELDGLGAMRTRLGNASYFRLRRIHPYALREGGARLVRVNQAVIGAETDKALRASHIHFVALHSAKRLALRAGPQRAIGE